MSNGYDTTSFKLDYCQNDVAQITEAVKAKASLLVIGMPGCGKSRLIDFIFNRPDVLEKYGLSNNLEAIRVDCDVVATDPNSTYIEFLRALDANVSALVEGSLTALKSRLMDEIQQLETDVDLVVIFDNFNRPLQQALGEDFLNFLYGLRNKRPKLNITYIFMANLKIDLAGFYRVERLFDKGVDGSIYWLPLLNQQDVFFSIDRQWRRVGGTPDKLNEVDPEEVKAGIYELGGGHALLGRYLSHLMLSGEVSVESEPAEILAHHGIRRTCEKIWHDLDQNHKNYLIDVAQGNVSTMGASESVKEVLENYGVLKEQTFFSPLFESFVKTQEKAKVVIDVGCDEDKTRIVIKTIDRHQISFSLDGLTPKKRTLLCYLAQNLSETCARDRLIEVGWPSDDTSEPKVYYQALSRQLDDLRKWLRDHKQLSQYINIENVWGVGYQLVIKG